MHSEDSGSHFPTHPPNTFHRATSLHLLEAMAQFIHLLLLLGMCHVAATYVYERQVWLLEGSSATFPFPSLRTIKYCGRGGSKCQCVSGGCTSNNASLPGVTVTDSTLTITNFTRENDDINLCFDSSPSNPPGRCVHLNVSIAPVNPTSVPPGPTPPQHSDEEEEEEEAMAQFIHLLLLLGMCHVAATYAYEKQVWLLEGSSATFPFPSLRTIKYCGRGGSKCECVSGKFKSNNASLPGVAVTDSNLTITNFMRENDGINLCYDTLKTECVHLNVSIGCSESGGITFAKGQPKHNKTTVADCRRLCTEDPTCQYFTFYINKTCYLMTSRDNMLIYLYSNAVSGYPAKDDCAPVNPTSVPPGPTPPQSTVEKEEEEGPKCQQMVFWS
ncbi:hypothetical protein ABVT39_019420 [Epinephelus coioides]